MFFLDDAAGKDAARARAADDVFVRACAADNILRPEDENAAQEKQSQCDSVDTR